MRPTPDQRGTYKKSTTRTSVIDCHWNQAKADAKATVEAGIAGTRQHLEKQVKGARAAVEKATAAQQKAAADRLEDTVEARVLLAFTAVREEIKNIIQALR